MSDKPKIVRVLRKGKTRKKKPRLSVVDIETVSRGPIEALPELFRFGVVLDDTGEEHRFTSLDELRRFLLCPQSRAHRDYLRNRSFWCHNGSGFDFLVLFPDMLSNLRWSVISSGTKIIMGKYRLTNKDYVKFYDSLNLLNSSVEKIGKALGLPKLTMEYSNQGEPNEEEWEYCKRDCEIIMKALQRLYDMCNVLKPSIAAQSLAYWRKLYLPSTIYVNEYDNTFGESYYGGRVEVYRFEAKQWNYYDINSLYPFVMANFMYPDPSCFTRVTNISKDELTRLINRYEGNAKLTVTVKDCYRPILPVKYNNKLIFPVGRITGRWNFPELRLAIKNKQIEIEQIHEVIYSTRVVNYFKNYVEDLYNKRKQSNNEYDKLVYKLFMNSLYGKFGQRIKNDTKYASNVKDLEEIENTYGDMITKISELKSGFYAVSLNLDKENKQYVSHSIVSWASYITSYARIINWQYQETIESKYGLKVAYTDTDSFFVDGEIPIESGLVGPELGQLKLEPEKVKDIIGPKNYKYIKDGKEYTKLKGVPKSAIETEDGKYQFNKIVKYKEAMRRGLTPGQSVEVFKVLKKVYDKRVKLSNGETRPIRIE